jgi:murein DD-endopeptidase MepM/ murein hydrolase activator NlpD
MITKKLKGKVFVWNPDAFNGKGYWFALGKNGSYGLAASKREAGYLNRPNAKQTESSTPEPEGETSQKQISSDTQKSLSKLKDKFNPKNLKNMFKPLGEKMTDKFTEEKDQSELFGKSKSPTITPDKIGNINTAFYNTTSSDRVLPIKKGDTIADVSTKIVALFNKIYEEKKLQKELAKNFEEEIQEEDKRRHEKLIKEIYKAKGMKRPSKGATNKTANKLKNWTDLTKIKIESGAGGVAKTAAAAVAIGGVAAAGTAAFISSKEGFAKKAYLDEGRPAIGFGHDFTEQELKQGYVDLGNGEKLQLSGEKGIETTITREQATKLLQQDLPKYEGWAAASVGKDNWEKLNVNQKAALTSYTYNTGPGGMQKLAEAGLKDAIAKGDMKEAAKIIKEKGIKTGRKSGLLDALVKRRNDESELFLKDVTKEDMAAGSNASASTQISSHFYRDSGALHGALDIPGSQGQPIFATGDGTVIYGKNDPNGYGSHWVIIDHGGGLQTWYGHMSDRVVENGAKVKAGQQIGKMGNEGRSSGTHLHYQITLGGPKNYQNPETFTSPLLSPWSTSVKGIPGAVQVASESSKGQQVASATSENKQLKQNISPTTVVNNAKTVTESGKKPTQRILSAGLKQDYPSFIQLTSAN